MQVVSLVKPKAVNKCKLLFNKRASEVGLMQHLKVGPNYYIANNDFGHTVLCYISMTKMFNKPASGLVLIKQFTNFYNHYISRGALSQKWSCHL